MAMTPSKHATTDDIESLPRYNWHQSYDWNFEHAPDPARLAEPPVPGRWDCCGLPVSSPLGVAAGPLLNGRWILYYASLGFDHGSAGHRGQQDASQCVAERVPETALERLDRDARTIGTEGLNLDGPRPQEFRC